MENRTPEAKQYTTGEAAKVCGLPESTLRYYEAIGLIPPIKRDKSSKQRVYSEDNVNHIIGVACLSAAGLPIEDMRQYLDNRSKGQAGAAEQIALLATHELNTQQALRSMQLRLQYIESKIAYWQAVESGDADTVRKAGNNAYAIAKKMNLPGSLPNRG